MEITNKNKQLFWMAAAFAGAILLGADNAFAAENPLQQVLCNVVDFVTGPVGSALATLAVIIIGVGALMGKVSWGMAIIVGLGVATVFGAPTLVNNIAGGSDNANCTGGSDIFGGGSGGSER